LEHCNVVSLFRW